MMIYVLLLYKYLLAFYNPPIVVFLLLFFFQCMSSMYTFIFFSFNVLHVYLYFFFFQCLSSMYTFIFFSRKIKRLSSLIDHNKRNLDFSIKKTILICITDMYDIGLPLPISIILSTVILFI